MQQLNFLFNIFFPKKHQHWDLFKVLVTSYFPVDAAAADFGYTCNSVLCLRKPCIFALLTVMHQSISSEALFATSRELTSSPLLQNSTFSSTHCSKIKNYVQKLFHRISPNSHVSKLDKSPYCSAFQSSSHPTIPKIMSLNENILNLSHPTPIFQSSPNSPNYSILQSSPSYPTIPTYHSL